MSRRFLLDGFVSGRRISEWQNRIVRHVVLHIHVRYPQLRSHAHASTQTRCDFLPASDTLRYMQHRTAWQHRVSMRTGSTTCDLVVASSTPLACVAS